MLQRDAAKVYAIDVGYGQLDLRLREDPRVVVMERTNARYLEALPDPIDVAVIDVSFISLALIFPAVDRILAEQGHAGGATLPRVLGRTNLVMLGVGAGTLLVGGGLAWLTTTRIESQSLMPST